MASEWEAMVEEGTGHTYYYNNATGVATWDKPEGFDDGATEGACCQAATAPNCA